MRALGSEYLRSCLIELLKQEVCRNKKKSKWDNISNVICFTLSMEFKDTCFYHDYLGFKNECFWCKDCIFNNPLIFSVRPKFGLGIGNRNQGPISVSVSELKFFSGNRYFLFKFFSFFPTSLGNISFYKLQNKPRS